MKFFLSSILLLLGGLSVFGQTANDRDLAGLKGAVKTIETSSQDTNASGKASYPVEKQQTDEYDKAGWLVKSTYHVSRGRSVFFMLDGKRVSKYQQVGPGITVQTVVGSPDAVQPPSEEKQTGDPRYEHKYTYNHDKSGRIIEIEDHKNDGTLWQVRKFTYDDAGRLTSETVTEKGRLSHGDTFKYDSNGTVIERGGVFYLFSGEKEVTPFRYSRIKLDSKGNWIERTLSQVEGDKAEIIAIETRKITYY